MNLRNALKKIMPPISQTEQEALDAGSTWIETSIFQGKPDFEALLDIPVARLTDDEKSFLDGPVSELMLMINDHEIQEGIHLPKDILKFLGDNGFYSLIIPKIYGGLEFSPYANSTIVGRIATKSSAVAVSVMVPNSLGPGELLMHYGTKEQQEDWLPSLANGTDIPCFALTSPEAGSDAGAIPDFGIVKMGQYKEHEVLGLEVTWDKRYITLAPIATVLGLAFKAYDPDGLLGDKEALGITCALIPSSHDGVEIGNRHDPMGVRFYNGTTRGNKVFIPMSFVIGGEDKIGKGWEMLVACLGAGRGVSLPAMGTATCQASLKDTAKYAYVREQFNTPIGKFEGIQEKLASMAGKTYIVEAMRVLTTEGLNQGIKPSVVTAIAKYHMTEIGREVINDAMDIQAGRAIQQGPNNILSSMYKAQPVGITVEGANILTRNLMIFGQGAIRCHPYMQDIIANLYSDKDDVKSEFNALLKNTIVYSAKNALRSFYLSFAPSIILNDDPFIPYKAEINELSANLATMSDIALLVMGGKLKKSEMLSARLGDMLSYLYAAMAITRFRLAHLSTVDGDDYYHYAMKYVLDKAREAKCDFIDNFPNIIFRTKLRILTGTFKRPSRTINDDMISKLAENALNADTNVFKVITGLTFDDDDDYLTQAYNMKKELFDSGKLAELKSAFKKDDSLPGYATFEDKIKSLIDKKEFSEESIKAFLKYEELRKKVIAVDEFDNDLNKL
jgi:alkylation response protein AidB-like acyl-CoA dehydrogenase